MSKKNRFYEGVHNYTKYKLVEMLITRHQEDKLNLDNLNSIEDLADDVLEILALCGLKYYGHIKSKGNNEISDS
jgi:hypothetical protein